MLDGTYNGQPTSIQYIAKEDRSLVLTHSIQIRNKTQGTWYDAFVDAHSGELVHVTDFVAKASVGRVSKNRCFKISPLSRSISCFRFRSRYWHRVLRSSKTHSTVSRHHWDGIQTANRTIRGSKIYPFFCLLIKCLASQYYNVSN